MAPFHHPGSARPADQTLTSGADELRVEQEHNAKETGSSKQRIIIDTDPGQDDAIAILLALAATDELDVLGLTCVAGNVPLPRTQVNARRCCDVAGRPDLPVYAGASRPMILDLLTAENVHGVTGLDGTSLPECPETPLLEEHAVDYIIRTLREQPVKSVILVCLAPMTNIALAWCKAPDVIARVQRIVIMGGSYFEGGNMTPAAEFNTSIDPHSLKIVLASGAPIVMIPLDVTHRVLTTGPRISALREHAKKGSKSCAAVCEMIAFFSLNDQEKYGPECAPLHDPCCIAWLLRPELFRGRHCNVEVECGSELTMGMTVVDWWGLSGRKPNVVYMTDADADGFFSMLEGFLSKLP